MKTKDLVEYGIWGVVIIACIFILSWMLNLVGFGNERPADVPVQQCEFGECETVETPQCPYAEAFKINDEKCVAPTYQQLAPSSNAAAAPAPQPAPIKKGK